MSYKRSSLIWYLSALLLAVVSPYALVAAVPGESVGAPSMATPSIGGNGGSCGTTAGTTCPTPSSNAMFGITATANAATGVSNRNHHRSFSSMLPPTAWVNMANLRGGAVLEPESAEQFDAELSNAAENNKLVIVDFSATWCGPCKAIAPIYHELSELEEFKEKVLFVKVDVDDHMDVAQRYSVSALPTFIFLKDGEVVDRVMGANVDRLQSLLRELA